MHEDGRHRQETIAFLREASDALASIDGPPANQKHFTIMPTETRSPSLDWPTRVLHGRDSKVYLTGKTVAESFHYDYIDAELDVVIGCIRALASQSDEVHIVNDNSRDFAPRGRSDFASDSDKPPGVSVTQIGRSAVTFPSCKHAQAWSQFFA